MIDDPRTYSFPSSFNSTLLADGTSSQNDILASLRERTAADSLKVYYDDDDFSTFREVQDEEQKVAEKPAPPPAVDPSSFPDGGLMAWSVVFGGWCSLFCSFGWINCIGVFQNYYETHQLQNFSPSAISWISSLEVFMMFAGGPVIGKLYDNYGPRYILLAGSFLHVFGLMMASISTQYYQFILAQGICSPIGASMIFYPSLNTIPTWFFKNRAFALGIQASGSSIGGVIFPILVQKLIPRVGFGWAMRSAAFLMILLLVIANLTVKSRLPPRPRPFVLMEFAYPLREPVYALTVAAAFLIFICLFIPINFIIVQAAAQGMSANLASYLIPILNAASLFGRIIPGWAADRVGRFNVLTLLMFITSIFVLALWTPSKDNAEIIVFTAIYGFGTGAFVSLIPAVIAQITKDLSKLGVRIGTMFALVSIAGLIGNPIAGAIITAWQGRFTGLQVFCGVIELAGASLFLAARLAETGFKFNVKV